MILAKILANYLLIGTVIAGSISHRLYSHMIDTLHFIAICKKLDLCRA
jgi:hypothetical protein